MGKEREKMDIRGEIATGISMIMGVPHINCRPMVDGFLDKFKVLKGVFKRRNLDDIEEEGDIINHDEQK